MNQSQKKKYQNQIIENWHINNNTDNIISDDRVITYKMDARDRRVAKLVNGVVVQRMIYKDQLEEKGSCQRQSQGDRLERCLPAIAILDAQNNVEILFVYGSKSNVPNYMIKNGEKYKYITDHKGSVLQVISYDFWGNVLSDTNPGFQPGWAEPVLGFCDCLRQPVLGFVGALNFYAYCSGEPDQIESVLGLYNCPWQLVFNWVDVTGKNVMVRYESYWKMVQSTAATLRLLQAVTGQEWSSNGYSRQEIVQASDGSHYSKTFYYSPLVPNTSGARGNVQSIIPGQEFLDKNNLSWLTMIHSHPIDRPFSANDVCLMTANFIDGYVVTPNHLYYFESYFDKWPDYGGKTFGMGMGMITEVLDQYHSKFMHQFTDIMGKKFEDLGTNIYGKCEPLPIPSWPFADSKIYSE